MTLTVSDYLEVNPDVPIEIVRVSSTASGDSYKSQKFNRIKSVIAQNHGNTYASGSVRDSPKIAVTQGSSTSNATITITHSAATEIFSLFIIGEL